MPKSINRPVPKYLQIVAVENDVENLAQSAYAMHCFWTGEMELGKIESVVTTEAGWLKGREVTRVVYNKKNINLKALTKKARDANCALKTYTTDQLNSSYRKSKVSDQKKQLSGWKAIHQVPGLTPMQKTKINAFAPSNRSKALEWLSPRQLRSFQNNY